MLCNTLKLSSFVTLVIKLAQDITGLHLNKCAVVLHSLQVIETNKTKLYSDQNVFGNIVSLHC